MFIVIRSTYTNRCESKHASASCIPIASHIVRQASPPLQCIWPSPCSLGDHSSQRQCIDPPGRLETYTSGSEALSHYHPLSVDLTFLPSNYQNDNSSAILMINPVGVTQDRTPAHCCPWQNNRWTGLPTSNHDTKLQWLAKRARREIRRFPAIFLNLCCSLGKEKTELRMCGMPEFVN